GTRAADRIGRTSGYRGRAPAPGASLRPTLAAIPRASSSGDDLTSGRAAPAPIAVSRCFALRQPGEEVDHRLHGEAGNAVLGVVVVRVVVRAPDRRHRAVVVDDAPRVHRLPVLRAVAHR